MVDYLERNNNSRQFNFSSFSAASFVFAELLDLISSPFLPTETYSTGFHSRKFRTMASGGSYKSRILTPRTRIQWSIYPQDNDASLSRQPDIPMGPATALFAGKSPHPSPPTTASPSISRESSPTRSVASSAAMEKAACNSPRENAQHTAAMENRPSSRGNLDELNDRGFESAAEFVASSNENVDSRRKQAEFFVSDRTLSTRTTAASLGTSDIGSERGAGDGTPPWSSAACSTTSNESHRTLPQEKTKGDVVEGGDVADVVAGGSAGPDASNRMRGFFHHDIVPFRAASVTVRDGFYYMSGSKKPVAASKTAIAARAKWQIDKRNFERQLMERTKNRMSATTAYDPGVRGGCFWNFVSLKG